jgi:hypothetical protein
VTDTAVGELQVPPRRFWVRVGSETVAEGTKWNGAGLTVHCPGRPAPVGWYASMEELEQNMTDWGWGGPGGAHVQWIDPDVEWHVSASATHGVAECAGVGE